MQRTAKILFIFAPMKIPTAIAACLFGIASCSDPQPSGERVNGYSQGPVSVEDSLFQVVMSGHDAAMAKMGKLSGYRKQAIQKADSLTATKNARNLQLAGALRTLADSLQASENRMNAWMEAFSIDSAQDDKPKRITYLESEIGKVNAIKEELLGNVSRADSLLR